MKLAKFLYHCRTIILLIGIQSCRPAQVINVRSKFDSDKKKLALTLDLIGNDKYKYDLDIKLSTKNLDYKISPNEISPKHINIGPSNDLSFTIISKSEILNDNFFLVKMTPKRRKHELNNSEISSIKSDTNKTIVDQLINPAFNYAATNKSFLSLGSNFLSNYPTVNYSNLTIGYGHIYSKMGYYIEIGGTLSTPLNTTLQNDKKSVITTHSDSYYYSFTNKSTIDRLSFSSGAMIRIAPSWIGLIGIGYGKRNEYWQVEEVVSSGTSYVKTLKYSQYVSGTFNGPQLQIGALIDFNKTHLKLNANLIPQTGNYTSSAPYIDAGISFGVNL